MSKRPPEASPEADDRAPEKEHESAVPADEAPKEIGGRQGPDPTRYGDWEKGGRCIDF
ncbi:MAG: DUF1674 domain-containing protein [Gammaproteobacteria bacterium]